MAFYTPLRYPGGKRRLVSSVTTLLRQNRLVNVHYAEPYAGGASIALALLFEEFAATISINDLSRPVFAFWHSVLNHPDELCRRIQEVRVNMKQWEKQRDVLDRQATAELIDLGFSTLFLNRTNRSGIITGGVIGGKAQAGAWTLDVRFNREELVRRIRRIGRYRSRIRLYQLDALEFTNEIVSSLGSKSFAFYDPPYIENGKGLYLNDYDVADHKRLAVRVGKLQQPWVVTYDYAAVKHGLYPGARRLIYNLAYTAQDRYRGKEVMFLSKGLKTPTDWSGRFKMSSPTSGFPFFGKMTLEAKKMVSTATGQKRLTKKSASLGTH